MAVPRDTDPIDALIDKNYTWEQVPESIKDQLSNSFSAWKQRVVQHAVRNQLRWSRSQAKKFLEEPYYYSELVRACRTALGLYPYHLQRYITRLCRVTPFAYYCEMLEEMWREEKSYDVMPNFTAADCLRLVGIGRNEYLTHAQTFKSKSWLWKKRKALRKEILPSEPRDFLIEPWWTVHGGIMYADDLRPLEGDVQATVGQLARARRPMAAGILHLRHLRILHKKGFVFLGIPVGAEDVVTVPSLEGFVMNRLSGDRFEQLLYNLFVSIDGRSTVSQLASVLDVPMAMVLDAVSVYIRLGFCKKRGGTMPDNLHPSWTTNLGAQRSISSEHAEEEEEGEEEEEEEEDVTRIDFEGVPNTIAPARRRRVRTTEVDPVSSFVQSASTPALPLSLDDGATTGLSKRRICFLFDSTVPGLLMMGNLGQGLKQHAITMFEVGKLTDEAVDSFVKELDNMNEISENEGHAVTYYYQAIALRNTIKFLRNNDHLGGGIDMIHYQSINGLDGAARQRLLEKNYALLISMSPLTHDIRTTSSCTPTHFGPPIPEVNSPWFRLFLCEVAGVGPPSLVVTKGKRMRFIPRVLEPYETFLLSSWTGESVCIRMENFLDELNQRLLKSPVLVQGFSCRQISEVALLPFPLRDTDCQDNSHLRTVAQQLQERLLLMYSFGSMQMLRLGQPNTTREDWVPLSVEFGFPFVDRTLNQDVCDRVQGFQLLTASNVAKHVHAHRVLSIRLLEFIRRKTDRAPLFESGEEERRVAFPTRDLVLVNWTTP